MTTVTRVYTVDSGEFHTRLSDMLYEEEQNGMAGLMKTIEKGSDLAYKVGQTIRSLRLDCKLTPRDFSDELNSTRAYVARLEQGLVDIDFTVISKSAQIFGVPIWRILDTTALHLARNHNQPVA